MGLFKRNKVWWMRFNYHGQQVRRSTDTSDRRLAEAILGKIRVDIVEGRYFEKREEQERTFVELTDRYLKEHVVRQLSQRSFSGYTKNLSGFKVLVQHRYPGRTRNQGVAHGPVSPFEFDRT